MCDGSTIITAIGAPQGISDAMGLHAQFGATVPGPGLHQGWDMHPGDLANRYRATDAFYRSVLSAAATRLTNSRTRQASGVMDEPATGRALAHRKRRVDQR